MILLIAILAILFGLSFWAGFRRLFRLEHLDRETVINSFLGLMIILTLMTLAHWLDILTQPVAANITMGIYTIAAGFFFGFGRKLISLRSDAGTIEYVYRSFWTEAAPALISIAVVSFGIYRTGVLTLGPFTGIGITSGLSLVAFGFWGWTIRVVPEFRSGGVLVLDHFIPWKEILSYSWQSEQSLRIDYYRKDNKITEFTTYVPEEDQVILERLLALKMDDHQHERKAMSVKADSNAK